MYTKDEVMTFVMQEDVKFIRLAFCDIFGRQKNISIMPTELAEAFEHGIPIDASAVPAFAGADVSEVFLVPDPSTLAILPWRPSHGRVVRMFCDIMNPDGTPFDGDTRRFLRSVISETEDVGVSIDIGAKFEFYLFRKDEYGRPTKIPLDQAGYLDIAPDDMGEDVRREICLTLADMGITPQSSHHEEGPGQHEIDFCRSGALEAADNAVTFKAAVKTIAMQSGHWATFSPKPLPDFTGNGMHLSISACDRAENDLSEHFMAGVMRHIRELSAFLNPTEESYRRLGEKKAPRYITWSPENNTQLIRFTRLPSQPCRRMELRSPDAESNPYIAYGLLILAGLEGIRGRLTPAPSENIDFRTVKKSVTDRLEALPSTLDEAKKLAHNSPFVRASLPEVIFSAYTESDV